jgi:hypothetical protein
VKNHEITKVVFLLITLALCTQCVEKSKKANSIERIDALILYYKQCDGTLCFSAANLLFEELSGDPLEWYQAMAKDTISFNRFLNDMEHLVFKPRTAYMNLENVESMRVQVLDRLKRKKVFKEFESMHERVIKRLEGIKVEPYK